MKNNASQAREIITCLIKLLATRTGAYLPRSALSRLSTFLNYLYTGRWMKEHQFSPRVRVRGCVGLTHQVAKSIADEEVLYLEFGVWKGDDFVDSPVVVIFLDADLFSSTSYVLKALRPHVKLGTIICFDDFWDPQHEQRAFEEFLGETRMKFELMVADYGMRHVAFKRIG